ncbi:hypothetical protein POW22_01425 [Gilvibacter sediminis]|nr:hypothetical protein [Gilvibacter sediminis]
MRQFLFLAPLLVTSLIHAQSYYNGRFTIETYEYGDRDFTLYDMSRAAIDTFGSTIGAKYFVANSYDRLMEWKEDKEILLITSAAYLDSWNVNAKPVGLSVDDGQIINRSPSSDMDGLVLFYTRHVQEGGVLVVDMDKSYVNIEVPADNWSYAQFNPRDNITDRTRFLNAAVDLGLSVWQTHLVYSEKKTQEENFANIYQGNERERRYLAITIKDNEVHHIVIDVPDAIKLLEGASDTKNILDYLGHEVLYILNLETGNVNFLRSSIDGQITNLDEQSGLSRNEAGLLRDWGSYIVWYVTK